MNSALRLPDPPWQAMAPAEPVGDTTMMNRLHPFGYQMWMNDTYTAIAAPLSDVGWAGMVHLSIRRNDRRAAKDWRDFQRIKDEVVGLDREACELYPSQARLVDNSNQFHLWVLPEGARFPFGFAGRAVSDDDHPMPGVDPSIAAGAVQRPVPADWLDGPYRPHQGCG